MTGSNDLFVSSVMPNFTESMIFQAHISSVHEGKKIVRKNHRPKKKFITLRIYRCTYMLFFFQMTKNHQLLESVHILCLNYFFKKKILICPQTALNVFFSIQYEPTEAYIFFFRCQGKNKNYN